MDDRGRSVLSALIRCELNGSFGSLACSFPAPILDVDPLVGTMTALFLLVVVVVVDVVEGPVNITVVVDVDPAVTVVVDVVDVSPFVETSFVIVSTKSMLSEARPDAIPVTAVVKVSNLLAMSAFCWCMRSTVVATLASSILISALSECSFAAIGGGTVDEALEAVDDD